MKSQAKILFVITQGFWGGAQKYVLDLATGLGPECEVHIAVGSNDAPMFEEKLQLFSSLSSSQIKIHPLNHLRREISPFQDIMAILELRDLYKELQPDIVHLNSSKAGVIGSLARTKKTKIIYTAHGWVFLEPLGKIRQNIYRLLEKYTATKKDALIVLSDQDNAIAKEELNIPSRKLFNIPLGIEPIHFLDKDTAKTALLGQENRLDPKKTWFGTIANHYRTKGLDLLIEAVSLLSESERNTLQFCIIGDGPEKKILQEKILHAGLSQTIFLLPFLDNASTYLRAFDLFVLPSRKEGLPYVLLEAFQAGLPLVATAVGGVPSLITNEKNGWLALPNNSSDLSKALAQSLLQKQQWSTISENNKKESTEYSLSQMISRTKKIYTELLKKNDFTAK